MPPALPYASPSELSLDADRIALAQRLFSEWANGNAPAFPGGALVVGRRGKMLEPHFVGRMGPEPDAEPIRRDAIFLLASITKPLVYTTALQLVERGELSLTDRVTDFFPEFGVNGKERTLVFHLLTHTSGLPDMPLNNVELRRSHAPLSKFVEAAINSPLLYPPGTNHRYQSMGTLMTAAIGERIVGRPIHEILREEVFEPLAMNSSRLGSADLD
ncbi:MAG TPA: serine hydrolase domain-containing protein, partial [Pirellulales bacterium]